MYYSDYHVHTHFSGDSSADPELVIREALNLGLKKLCLTDHFDEDFPYDDICFIFDVTQYFNTLKALQLKYAKDIELLIGVELGLQPHLSKKYTELLRKYPFDFVIGSSHLVDKQDPYKKTYYENKSEYEAYYHFLEVTIENIESFQGFQVYGHLDYIIRYGSYDQKYLSYDKYSDILDKLLLKLIDLGKGIEINTSGLRYGLGHPHPNEEILKRYKALGGEILTIGSDAHTPKDLCSGFDKAYELLKNMGYKYHTVFVNQKPEFIKIP
jgi:histidinol-phosphatase (PHP family)